MGKVYPKHPTSMLDPCTGTGQKMSGSYPPRSDGVPILRWTDVIAESVASGGYPSRIPTGR